MLRLASDTSPEVEEIQIQLLSKATPTRRFELALSLSSTVRELAWQGIQRANPQATKNEIDLLFVEYHYGTALAQAIKLYLAHKSLQTSPGTTNFSVSCENQPVHIPEQSAVSVECQEKPC